MTTLLQELDKVLARGDIHEMHQFLRDEHEEIRAALELQGKLGVMADDWNRRDKESRERGGSRIYVTDCANELRHALNTAPPAGGQDGT